MNASDLLRRLDAAGVQLTASGDRLKVDAPRGSLSAEDRSTLAEHKSAVLAALSWPPRDPRLANWSVKRREAWGRRANELIDSGLHWRIAERQAFLELAEPDCNGMRSEAPPEQPKTDEPGAALIATFQPFKVVLPIGKRPKATVYTMGTSSMARSETSLYEYGRTDQGLAQHTDFGAAPFVKFCDGPRSIASYRRIEPKFRYLLVLAGHGHLDPSNYIRPWDPTEGPYWRPGLLKPWDEAIDRYVADNAVPVLADFRDIIRPEFQQRIVWHKNELIRQSIEHSGEYRVGPTPTYYPAGTEPSASAGDAA
jgi:hypothetical protein